MKLFSGLFQVMEKRIIRINLIIAALILIVLCQFPFANPVYAASNVYYVAKNGSDSYPGTVNQPWLTIQKAANTIVAGDTVYIKAGTYSERVIPKNSGTTGSYITYKNYGSDVVYINAGSNIENIYGNRKNYLQFIGLRLTGTTTYGINISGSSYIILKNLYLANSKSCGILGYGTASYVTIDGCEVTKTNTKATDEGISLAYINNFEIKNCMVHDITASGRVGIDVKHGCSNGSIHDNEVYNVSSAGIYLDAHGQTISNVSIYNNKIHDNDNNWGIQIFDEVGSSSVTGLSIYNNLIYNNRGGIGILFNASDTYNFKIINNTLYNTDDGTIVNIYIAPSYSYLKSCVVRNNIIYSLNRDRYGIKYTDYSKGGVTIDHNLFYNSGGSWISGNRLGTSYVTSDPLFTNKTGYDFALTSSSPAKDKGSSTSAPSFDYNNITRPQGTTHDIGAYEYGNNPISAAPESNSATSAILHEYNHTGNSSDIIYGSFWHSQTFTPVTSHTITAVKLNMAGVGTLTGLTLNVGIRATDTNGKPTGSNLASGSLSASSITSGYSIYTITLGSGYYLTAGKKYAIIMSLPGGTTSNRVNYKVSTTNVDSGGNCGYSTNSGSTWGDYSSWDAWFEEWGN
jgi:hypothetical protein